MTDRTDRIRSNNKIPVQSLSFFLKSHFSFFAIVAKIKQEKINYQSITHRKKNNNNISFKIRYINDALINICPPLYHLFGLLLVILDETKIEMENKQQK